MLEYIRHVEELQIVSMIRENSGLYSFDSEFGGGGHLVLLDKLDSSAPCEEMYFLVRKHVNQDEEM